MTESNEVVGVLVPGDGRLRFCWPDVPDLRAGEWVALDGPEGTEPGRLVSDGRRVEVTAPFQPVFAVTRRLSSGEVRDLMPVFERARSLTVDVRRAIVSAGVEATIASLRFTLDRSVVLCHCFGESPQPPDALETTLRDAVGQSVRIEWTYGPARGFGGLGRVPVEAPQSDSTVRRRLGLGEFADFPNGWPRLGSVVRSPHGTARLIAVSVRHNIATVRLDTGDEIEVPVDELGSFDS